MTHLSGEGVEALGQVATRALRRDLLHREQLASEHVQPAVHLEPDGGARQGRNRRSVKGERMLGRVKRSPLTLPKVPAPSMAPRRQNIGNLLSVL